MDVRHATVFLPSPRLGGVPLPMEVAGKGKGTLEMNQVGVSVLMYDKKAKDNIEKFIAVGERFVYTAPKDFLKLGLPNCWDAVHSDGEQYPSFDDSLENGEVYQVQLKRKDGEEYPYPKKISGDEEEEEEEEESDDNEEEDE